MRISCYRTAWIRGPTFKCDTSKPETLNQWWIKVGPASQTLAQPWSTIGLVSRRYDWKQHTHRGDRMLVIIVTMLCRFFCEVGITCCIKAACALSLITITWIYDRAPWKVRLPLPESCYGLVLCSAIRAGRSCRGYAECLACQSQRARPPL